MSDSLRDQLLQAGFSAPREKPKRAHKPSGKTPGKSASSRSTDRVKADAAREQARQVEQRKQIKARIKALIEDVGIKDIQGESVYRFMLNRRIRELHLKEDIRRQLVDGVLVITRLNGSTWVIPADTVEQIRSLNPDWVIVMPASDRQDADDDYSEFQVPDDLQW